MDKKKEIDPIKILEEAKEFTIKNQDDHQNLEKKFNDKFLKELLCEEYQVKFKETSLID